MASRIQGITVEIGGDTTKLTTALSQVNKEIKGTQSQLRDVDKLLKLDPGNTVLLAQKQALLTDAIEQTSRKLEQLESAQEQVTDAFQKGDIGKDQYMAFQREIEETKTSLMGYKSSLGNMAKEQEELAKNTERLNKLFAATGTNVDDYADVLGNKLANAIRSGTANSDQLRSAIEKIGKSATQGRADIGKINEALDQVDDGQAIRNLVEDLNQVGDAAQEAADDIGEIAQAAKGSALMEAADQLSAVGCTSQQDALNMAAKAFGTMVEDGNLKFIISLTSVGSAYDSVSGSAQNLFDQTSTLCRKWRRTHASFSSLWFRWGKSWWNWQMWYCLPLWLSLQRSAMCLPCCRSRSRILS